MTRAPKPPPAPLAQITIDRALFDQLMQLQFALIEAQGALDEIGKRLSPPPPRRTRKRSADRVTCDQPPRQQ